MASASWPALLKLCLSSVLSGRIPPTDILKLFISKSLGYCILAGACITKLPQISAVVRSGSAAGLSKTSFELETLGLMIHTMYGYLAGLSFSAYGEASILCVQSLILLVLIYRLSSTSVLRVGAVSSALLTLVGGVVTGRVGLDLIRVAFDANNLVYLAARVPQITSNWRAKSTGQLSIITCSINLVGCIVRIFTSITEKAGSAMIRQYTISLVLNGILVIQILMYAANTKAAAAKAAAKKNK